MSGFQSDSVDVRAFKKEYGYANDWSGIKYRPGIPFTTPFGLDMLNGHLRIHLGIDRAGGQLFCPFDLERTEWLPDYYSYGTMLTLFPKNADFEVRIAHLKLERLPIEVQLAICNGKPLNAGQLIGLAGNSGLSVSGLGGDGSHTHTEIVSTGSDSAICESVIMERDPDTGVRAINRATVASQRSIQQVLEFEHEMQKRKIEFLSTTKCVRYDYKDGKQKTFYDSHLVFSM